jgi:hypothetical protein
VKRILSKLCWLPLVVVITGCDTTPTPEPETTLRALSVATKDLLEFMQKIQDAKSAQAAIPDLDSKLAAVSKNIKERNRLMGINEIQIIYLANRHLYTPFEKQIAEAALQVTREEERIKTLTDLPAEFWKAYMISGINATLPVVESSLSSQDIRKPRLLQFLKDMLELFQKSPYEETLQIELVPSDDEFVKKTLEKLKKLVPDATIYHCETERELKFEIVMAPVKDLNAVASGIDTGTIVQKNPSMRFLRIAGVSSKHIDPEDFVDNSGDFGSLPKKPKQPKKPKKQPANQPPEATPPKQDQPQPKPVEPQPKPADSQPKAAEPQQPTGETDNKKTDALADQPGLDPKAPDFYDKLAERINSAEGANSERAIDALLQTAPSSVSPEITKKIARAFKQLAESKSPAAKKGIKGLIVWGGKYSGPVLLKLLERPQAADEEQLIEALAQIKHPPAAAAIAARLGSFDLYQCAFTALQEMGSEAEDALMAAAPSQNPQIALAAVELLGLCGNQKCLPVLNKVLAHPHPKVREACDQSIRKIKDRSRETKD